MGRLVVSAQSLQVLASDQGIFAMLGYDPNAINGLSILAITGAESDTRMLQSAIESMQGLKMQLILYDASGHAKRLIVSCSPYYENFLNVRCLLTIQPSEVVTLQDAFADCLHARALVSADYPHAIHMANGAFLDRFSCGRQDVLGQPLHFFSRMDSTSISTALTNPCSADFEEAWSALLDTALDGRVARQRKDVTDDVGVLISGNDTDEVTCAPVVEAPTGLIRHLVVSFGPPPGVGSADERFVDGCRLPHPSQSAKRRVRPGLEKTAEAATGTKSAFLVCPRLRSLGHAILPRRKPSLEVSRSLPLAPPVVVTRELIAALADLPLNKAAAAAGVSASAFKKACRKLGVLRWAYKRGRSALSVSVALSGAYVPGAGRDAGLESCCASVDSESRPVAPATPSSASLRSAATDGEPETDGRGSARRDLWACLWDDVGETGAAQEFQDAGVRTCSAAAFTPAQSCPAAQSCSSRAPTWMAPALASGLQVDGGWSATGAAAAIGPSLEAPAVDETLVREMLDMPWPLQA